MKFFVSTKIHVTELCSHGFRHFADFEKKIPREEIVTIEKFVKKAIAELDRRYIITICGSYRRGKAESGDIDVLITHPSYNSKDKESKHKSSLLKSVVDCLVEKKLITDTISQGGAKFMVNLDVDSI